MLSLRTAHIIAQSGASQNIMMRRELFNGCEVSHIIVPHMLSVCRSENNRLPHRGGTLVRISRRELFNGCEVFHMTPACLQLHAVYFYCSRLRCGALLETHWGPQEKSFFIFITYTRVGGVRRIGLRSILEFSHE